ncbi:hypothetical protein EC957_003944 [Mortierella hygrophila]|uniref:BTB domain-containing protein n=1 Tax=Mortierella hygrophila TaxID=979708 RepID=A0A9P6F243_9FUNG|nr:hypothetical protein EC957_003944 [Mortierella hygrophila]
MASVAESLNEVKETTLRVVLPLLSDNNAKTITSTPCAYNSYWSLTLTRSGKMLTIGVLWNSGSHCDYTYYNSMLVFARGEYDRGEKVSSGSIMFMNGGTHKGTFEAEKVIRGSKYDFEIVFCTGDGLFREPTPPTPPKNMDIIPLLLKDANSVDVCFTFTSDKVYSNVGLWAHRVVLARHKVFAKLLQQRDELQSLVASTAKAKNENDKAAKLDSDTESTCTVSADGSPTPSPIAGAGDTRSLVINVDKFSLAAFCALLYYIYTDEVHLAIDTDRFAISSSEGSLVWRDPTTGKTRDSVRWHPTDCNSPWKLKDVTWNELLEAADYYGITDLRANCVEKVISGMNQSNVVGTLFSKSANGVEVRQAAMEFIVKHWGSIFQKGKDGCSGVDPFAAYRGHEECHEVLIELMHMKAKSA